MAARKRAGGTPAKGGTPETQMAKRPNRPPTRKRRWKTKDFLEQLALTRSVSAACRVIGITTTPVYNYRREDEAFRDAWDSVVAQWGEEFHDSMRHRATFGQIKPIIRATQVIEAEEVDPKTKQVRRVKRTIYEQVGEERVFETALSIWFGETRYPERYMRKVIGERAAAITAEDQPSGTVEEFL